MKQLLRAQSHVGITVRDLDESVHFYHDLLGLEICTEPSPWFDGPELGRGVGVPGAALRQVCLRLGDTLLELLEYRTPPSATERPLLSHCVGASHVAFQVADIAAPSPRWRRRASGSTPTSTWSTRGPGRLALGVLRRSRRLPAGTRRERLRAARRARRRHRALSGNPPAAGQ